MASRYHSQVIRAAASKSITATWSSRFSLTAAYEATGARQQSVDTTRKALEVLAKQELTAAQRQAMADIREARLNRLR